MRENICKWCEWQGINLQNLQKKKKKKNLQLNIKQTTQSKNGHKT